MDDDDDDLADGILDPGESGTDLDDWAVGAGDETDDWVDDGEDEDE